MQYRSFGSLDFEVSALGFGAMRLPVKEGEIDETEATRMIHYAVDHGVNFIDTAYVYHNGTSEGFVGKALKDGYREKVMLTTKLPSWDVKSKADFDRFLDEQLRRLDVDYLDFYLLHSMNKKRWIELRDLGILDWAEKAMADGYFRHLGFSFHDDTEAFKQIIDDYSWAMCLVQYNYMDINNQAGREGVQYAADKGVAVAVMEPLLGGNLASRPESVQTVWDKASNNRTPVEWALHWLWSQPEVSTVLSGMSTMEQVKENVAYAAASRVGILTPEELALFDEARMIHESLTAIPCTECGYCKPCPSGVDITENISLYNDAVKYEMLEACSKRYRWWENAYKTNPMFGEKIQAANCTSCGECEEKCPQSIPISQWMETIDDVLGKGKPIVKKLEQ